MNSAQIVAYDSSERLVARGWTSGLVEIAHVNPADGSPADLVSSTLLHGSSIICLEFIDCSRIVVVDDLGHIVVCAIATGKPVWTSHINGRNVSAALAPDRTTLFVYVEDVAES